MSDQLPCPAAADAASGAMLERVASSAPSHSTLARAESLSHRPVALRQRIRSTALERDGGPEREVAWRS